MNIAFEMPTNSRAELEYIKSVARESENVYFSVVTNGPELSKNDNCDWSNLTVYYSDGWKGRKAVALNGYRMEANQLATDFNPDHRVIADANFKFNSGWEAKLIATMKQVELFQQLSGRRAFLSMRTMLGRQHWNSANGVTVCSLPILPTACGIFYPGFVDLFAGMRICEGGMGDILLSSRLIKVFGLVPLTQHQTFIFHRHVGSNESLVDRDLWTKGNLKEVRELWGDPYWRLPDRFGSKRKAEPPEYFATMPKTARPYVKAMRAELLKNKKLGAFIRANKGE